MGDECEGGIQCAKTLLNCKEPLTINRVTTDADGCLAEGIQSHYMHSKAGVEIEHSLDPPHLNRSLCAALSRAKFSPDMFPGKTRREKSNLQDRFADDLSHRAQAEAAAILKEHRGPILRLPPWQPKQQVQFHNATWETMGCAKEYHTFAMVVLHQPINFHTCLLMYDQS